MTCATAELQQLRTQVDPSAAEFALMAELKQNLVTLAVSHTPQARLLAANDSRSRLLLPLDIFNSFYALG